MKCVICKQGETRQGAATVTLERGTITLVVRHVPAEICDVCGEEYVSEEAAERALETAERAAAERVTVEIRDYRAA